MTKTARVGVWEGGRFIGAVVFSCGAAGATNGKRYGLKDQFEMAELQRVALTQHTAPVTQMLAVACRMIRKQYKGLRLLISYADPNEGHHGGIYQAGGWVFTGTTPSDKRILLSDGRWVHSRTVNARWGEKSKAGKLKRIAERNIPGKYRYLFPLDSEMRKRIAPFAKPYPKRATSVDSDVPANHAGEGGASPTVALSTHEQNCT